MSAEAVERGQRGGGVRGDAGQVARQKVRPEAPQGQVPQAPHQQQLPDDVRPLHRLGVALNRVAAIGCAALEGAAVHAHAHLWREAKRSRSRQSMSMPICGERAREADRGRPWPCPSVERGQGKPIEAQAVVRLLGREGVKQWKVRMRNGSYITAGCLTPNGCTEETNGKGSLCLREPVALESCGLQLVLSGGGIGAQEEQL